MSLSNEDEKELIELEEELEWLVENYYHEEDEDGNCASCYVENRIKQLKEKEKLT